MPEADNELSEPFSPSENLSPELLVQKPESLLEQLNRLAHEHYEEDWDGESSARLSPASLKNAYSFSHLIYQIGAIPEVGVGRDGEVIFDWIENQTRTGCRSTQ